MTASEQITRQYAAGSINKRDWGPVLYNVKLYGAAGDGVTDDSGAVFDTFTAAAVTGGMVLFPPGGTYKLDIPTTGTMSNVQIIGYGATIDCRGSRDVPGVNGTGGGFTLTGNNNEVEGLSFIGYAEVQGSTNYGAGKFLRIVGDLNKIVNCKFKDGNSGAIMLNGNKNTISKSNFDTCNNHFSEGADYGAIHVLGGYGNTISECWIENQYYAGITLIGPTVSKTTIDKCYIKGSNPLGLDTSMGIYAFTGAGRDLVITNCTIENNAAEAIVIFSSVANPSDSILIANNTLRDYEAYSIAIYESDGGASTNVKIQHNLCQSRAVSSGQHIYTQRLKRSSICNNTIVGSETGVGTIGNGIYVGNSPESNVVKNNEIFNVNLGIFYADTLGGDVSENMIVMCSTGIQYQNCQRAKITNNNVINCTTPMSKMLNADYTFVTGNMVSGYTTAPNGVLLYGDVQTTSGATTPYVTGTLVAGTKTLTFPHINDGDAFVVIPTTYLAAANCGSLYIAAQDQATDQMVVKSTNAADTRSFVVIKVATGVV